MPDFTLGPGRPTVSVPLRFAPAVGGLGGFAPAAALLSATISGHRIAPGEVRYVARLTYLDPDTGEPAYQTAVADFPAQLRLRELVGLLESHAGAAEYRRGRAERTQRFSELTEIEIVEIIRG